MSKKESAEKAPAEPQNIEELILNFKVGKYSAIPLAAQWARVLRRKEEHRHLTSNEILDLALRNVLGGDVDWKDVKKALASLPAADSGIIAAAEEKAKEK